MSRKAASLFRLMRQAALTVFTAGTGSLLVSGCLSIPKTHDQVVPKVRTGDPARAVAVERDIGEAILARSETSRAATALWRLFCLGREVRCPREIWFQGPTAWEAKSEIETLMGLHNCRLSQVDNVHYVFYGDADAKQELSLLSVCCYPDSRLRFRVLASVLISDDSAADPGIHFDQVSRWDLPQSYPQQ